MEHRFHPSDAFSRDLHDAGVYRFNVPAESRSDPGKKGPLCVFSARVYTLRAQAHQVHVDLVDL